MSGGNTQVFSGVTVFALWSLNLAADTEAGVNPAVLSNLIAAAITSQHGTPVGQYGHPEVNLAPISAAMTDRWVMTATATFQVLGGINVTSEGLNFAVAEAFKNAGGGSGLSVQRIANGFDRNANIGELLSLNPAITACHAEFRASANAATALANHASVDSPLGSTLAAAGTAPIARSSNPERVGQSLPPTNGSIFDNIGSAWNAIPSWAKLAGGLVGATVLAVGVGYTVRSFK